MKKLLLIFILIIVAFLIACAHQIVEPLDESSSIQEVIIETFEEPTTVEEITIAETEPETITEIEPEPETIISTEETTELETTLPEPTQEETSVPTPKPEFTFIEMDTLMYATEKVRARTKPNTDGTIYTVLGFNQEVHVTGQCIETGWYRIELDRKVLYVSNGYLTQEKAELNKNVETIIHRPSNNLEGFIYYTVAGRYPNRSYEEYLYSCLNDLGISWWYPYAVAQIWQESKWSPSATNGKDHGICQFRGIYFPSRAAHHANFPDANIWNPYDSLYVYAHYMRDILRTAGTDIHKALSYYMAGEWGVSYGGYVSAVMNWYNRLEAK